MIKPLKQVERETILGALAEMGWNRTHAALALRIPYRTMSQKLRTYRAQGHYIPDSPHDWRRVPRGT